MQTHVHGCCQTRADAICVRTIMNVRPRLYKCTCICLMLRFIDVEFLKKIPFVQQQVYLTRL